MNRFEDKVMSAFAKRLKKARVDAGFSTAKSFADSLGIEENRYRHWERGTAQPTISMITRISRLLQVEIQELLPLGYRRARSGDDGRTAA